MSRKTLTKIIREHYARDGKPLPPLPQGYKPCLVCGEKLFYADGSIAVVHGECRKEYRSKKEYYNKHGYKPTITA